MVYTPIADATGTIVALVDASTGQVAASYRYDLWGNPLSASGAAAGACPFGFAGMYRDGETGLYHTPNREYNPVQHRWLTRDPSGESGGVNLYAYCGNDPVNRSDPTGLVAPPAFKVNQGRPATTPARAAPPSAVIGPPAPAAQTGLADAWGWITRQATSFWNEEAGGLQAAQNLLLTNQIGDDNTMLQTARRAFDESNFDRENGVEDEIIRRTTRFGHSIAHQYIDESDGNSENFAFDPENRANAAKVGGVIIDATALAVSTVSGAQALNAALKAGGLAGTIGGALTNGQTITAVVINGREVALTAGALVAAGVDANSANNLIVAMSRVPNLDMGKQGKHIPGHNNFIPGRSVLTADPAELAKSAGTGTPVGSVPRGSPGFKERINFGKIIGNYVDPVTGTSSPTTNGIIIYAKDGIHIIPARP